MTAAFENFGSPTLARARHLFKVGPSSTDIEETTSSSISKLLLCSAFATAEFNAFEINFAAFFSLKLKDLGPLQQAFHVFDPPLASSFAPRFLHSLSSLVLPSLLKPLFRFFIRYMSAVSSGGRKLTKFVTNHILSYKYRNMLPPIIDRYG